MTSPSAVPTSAAAAPRREATGRAPAILAVLMLLALSTAVFAPVLKNGFVQWDDNVYVTENATVQRRDPGAVLHVFTEFVSGNYHPITQLTYWVEHRLVGLWPLAYHATNLGLHAANAALCFWLLRLLGCGLTPAFTGALLFCLHPLRAEPVAWVTGRKDLLSTFFYLLAAGAYLRYRARSSCLRYLTALGLFGLSLLSKATAVSLPLTLLLCDYLSERRLDRRAWLEKAPFLTLALAAGAAAVVARQSYQGVLQEGELGLWSTLTEGAYRITCYTLARTAVPTFSFFTPYPPSSLYPSAGVVSLAALVALAAGVALTVRYTRKIIFGAGWFFVAIAPSLAAPVVGYSADRFSYLPSVGLAYLAAEGFGWWHRRAGARLTLRIGLWCLLAAAAAGLALLSRQRAEVWRDSVSLWSDGIDLYAHAGTGDRNLALAHVYRAQGYRAAGELERALEDTRRAIQIHPETAEAYAEQGIIHVQRGALEAARADLHHALELQPDYLPARLQRAMLRQRMGDTTAALQDFDAALTRAPGDPAILNERGIALAASGALQQAIADFTQATEVAPGWPTPLVNRGIALLSLGETQGAMKDFDRTLAIEPNNAAAYFGRSQARAQRGDLVGAAQDEAAARELGYGAEASIGGRPKTP